MVWKATNFGSLVHSRCSLQWGIVFTSRNLLNFFLLTSRLRIFMNLPFRFEKCFSFLQTEICRRKKFSTETPRVQPGNSSTWARPDFSTLAVATMVLSRSSFAVSSDIMFLIKGKIAENKAHFLPHYNRRKCQKWTTAHSLWVPVKRAHKPINDSWLVYFFSVCLRSLLIGRGRNYISTRYDLSKRGHAK